MIRLNFIKLLIISFYSICWFSISSTFNDFYIFTKNTLTLSEIINFTRHILVYICLVLSLILIFMKDIKNVVKKNLTLVFLLIYFISQIPGLFLTPNSTENISFIISSITIICTIILINEFFSVKEKGFLVFIPLTILACVFIISLPNLYEYLEGSSSLYGYFNENTDLFFNKASPRSSGLSRTCLIIILMIYIIETFFSNKKRIILNIFKIFLLTIILLFQSRTIIFLTFLIHIFIFIYTYEFSIKNLIKFLSYYLLLPLLLAFFCMDYLSRDIYKTKVNKVFNKVFSEYGRDIYKTKINKEILEHESAEILKERNIFIKKGTIFRKFDSFSSGRFNDWKLIIYNFNIKNIYFGYGSQGDRFLINQTASNGIIYAVVCSGLIGLLFYILFTTIIFLKIFKNIFVYEEKEKKNFYSSLIILVILMRSILESSYAVFSIDLIILLTFFTLINKNEVKNII